MTKNKQTKTPSKLEVEFSIIATFGIREGKWLGGNMKGTFLGAGSTYFLT